ncbi:MAG: M1 family metallopeptidase [Clostridia bacterium]|nr:M1 family metallopeptidase [Clostridia bacterium]
MVFSCCLILFSGCNAKIFSSDKLTTYNLTLNLNENKTVNAKQTVKYVNSSNNVLNNLMFHLYPNAFREDAKTSVVSLANEHKAYPNGKSYGKIDILKVKVANHNANLKATDENLTNPSFEITGEDENILKINLEKELFPNEIVEIEIEFELTLPNINHRFGFGEDTINLGNFYPIACIYENGNFKTDLYSSNGDPFYSNMANYNVEITYPKNYTLASTGDLISTKIQDGTKIDLYSARNVRDFAMVLSDKFKILSTNADETTINYYYFSDSQPEKSLQTAKNAIETFNNLIGKYPYKTLNVCETNFVHGGMEYPNIIYISNDILDHSQYEQVIVHETAHQWWYNLVGNSEYDYAWLDEGLTEYTTALFYELNDDYEIKKEALIDNAYSNYQMFVEVYGSVYGKVDTSMNRALNEFKTEPEYVYITYVKGMLLFDSLREILGDKKFEKCLKQYFEENKYKISKPENLISSFEKASKTKLESFFNAWLDGKVILLN